MDINLNRNLWHFEAMPTKILHNHRDLKTSKVPVKDFFKKMKETNFVLTVYRMFQLYWSQP